MFAVTRGRPWAISARSGGSRRLQARGYAKEENQFTKDFRNTARVIVDGQEVPVDGGGKTAWKAIDWMFIGAIRSACFHPHRHFFLSKNEHTSGKSEVRPMPSLAGAGELLSHASIRSCAGCNLCQPLPVEDWQRSDQIRQRCALPRSIF